MTATLQELQNERLTQTELRVLLEEQQLQYKKAEDEKKKALEVMPNILTSSTKRSDLMSYFCTISYPVFLFNHGLQKKKSLLVPNVHGIFPPQN